MCEPTNCDTSLGRPCVFPTLSRAIQIPNAGPIQPLINYRLVFAYNNNSRVYTHTRICTDTCNKRWQQGKPLSLIAPLASSVPRKGQNILSLLLKLSRCLPIFKTHRPKIAVNVKFPRFLSSIRQLWTDYDGKVIKTRDISNEIDKIFQHG